VTVGSDTALVEVGDRATTAFAIGPRSAAAGREPRLRAAAAALGAANDAVAWVNQVHGHDLVDVGVGDVGCVGAADGLMTVRMAHGLAVWSADCVPMLMAGRWTVAAVHAGWRGCAAGIVERSIERLCDVYREEAANLEIRLGPAIGADHYRVGTEVVEALARRAGTDEGWLQAGSYVDLRAFVRRRVVACGVPAEQVVELGGCTACDPTLASYRRDGARAGRQWSMIVRRGLT
jgi:hypothetical protein